MELLPGPEERDDYGRLLAFVRTEAGEIFNVTLVREGFAHAFLKFPFDEALRKELRAAESEAREAGRGLWREEPYPVVAAADAGRRVGEVLTVRFRCRRSLQARRIPPARGRGGRLRRGHPARGLQDPARLPRFRGPDARGDRPRRAL
ncbi:MAG: thermonuclease family protein [Desulfomicrobium escambiense]|nr:thermonuclease family protein [Desulfomicrobium escambiense]